MSITINCVITLTLANKKLESIKVSVNGQSCFSGYKKDPFFVCFSLLYFCVIYFILKSILMLLVMLMTTPHIVLILTLKTQFQVLNHLLHDYLIGFSETQWKRILKTDLLLNTNQDKLANINKWQCCSQELFLEIILNQHWHKFEVWYLYVNNLCKKPLRN